MANPISFRPSEKVQQIFDEYIDDPDFDRTDFINRRIENGSMLYVQMDKHHETLKMANENYKMLAESSQERLEMKDAQIEAAQKEIKELESKLSLANNSKESSNQDLMQRIENLTEENQEIKNENRKLMRKIDDYETKELKEIFDLVFGNHLRIEGDKSRKEFLVMNMSDLVEALVYQYRLQINEN